MRMVWGYRHHLPDAGYPDTIPLSRRPHSNTTLPRRSFEIYEGATGIILIENAGTQATDLDSVEVGDLVFFDVERDDGPRLDHVGMYLGADTSRSAPFHFQSRHGKWSDARRRGRAIDPERHGHIRAEHFAPPGGCDAPGARRRSALADHALLMYSSTFFASTSSGTLPPSTTVSLNALRSNFAPSAAFARSRCRLISLWPTL